MEIMVTNPRILIIDDDPDCVQATKSVLERYYHVSCAYNGREGWRKLRQEKPDLIILDLMMDKKAKGLVFGRELRKERDSHNIPAIMLTEMARPTGSFFAGNQLEHSGYLPFDVFMEKPVNPAELLTNAEDLLRKKSLPKEQSIRKPGTRQEGRKLILIVEPDRETAMEYERIFKDEGCDVDLASYATQAVKKVKDVRFDCIIIDVSLPDMAGYDAVAVIKTIAPKTNIIITAGKNTKELEAKIRNEDIFYYYIKSFDREELKLAVRNVLKKVEGSKVGIP
jgi:DNA-binding response OmpR family regulator